MEPEGDTKSIQEIKSNKETDSQKRGRPIVKSDQSERDHGMVAYFEGSCPAGWEEFESAQDRFILGASTNRSSMNFGGSETHTMTQDELVAHQHRLFGP